MMKAEEWPISGTLQDRAVERSQTTFYLNVAEQLMKLLSNDYVEAVVLPCCRPYLDNPKYRDTFESAHSVLLAIFSSEKEPIANAIAPWYTQLLLRVSSHLPPLRYLQY